MVVPDRIIVHDYDKALQSERERLKQLDICQENKEAIANFLDYCIETDLSKARQRFYAIYLRKIAGSIAKPFKDITREDLEKFILWVNKHENWSDHTKQAFKVTIKKFWKWLYRTEEDPEMTRWIRTTVRNAERKVYPVFTADDLKHMIERAESLRDKLLISILGELGCRIGELLSCRLKHILINGNSYRLVIKSGKSGELSQLLLDSVPLLISYLNYHPRRGDPNAPLFYSFKRSGELVPLSYSNASNIVKYLARRCNLNIRIHPHMFRAFAATELILNRVPEDLIKKRLGWSPTSKVLAVYSRTTNADVDRVIMEMKGVTKKPCKRCGFMLDNDARLCERCGTPTSIKEAIDTDDEIRKYDDLMAMLLQDQDIRQLIKEKLKSMSKDLINLSDRNNSGVV